MPLQKISLDKLYLIDFFLARPYSFRYKGFFLLKHALQTEPRGRLRALGFFNCWRAEAATFVTREEARG